MSFAFACIAEDSAGLLQAHPLGGVEEGEGPEGGVHGGDP
jgi:hypothetical protein